MNFIENNILVKDDIGPKNVDTNKHPGYGPFSISNTKIVLNRGRIHHADMNHTFSETVD